ncbi:Enhancer of mRNA-decapping protein 4 [Porphyridium purpureum]|uniref:Enhancer of mRNA-decapping protein 4 n=1 Tax=Porphyridium purpureum TaxID=35688 RepID=A0A5J4YT36_PORPP|nr:Enhancer of mRNA-decapping protein 4 [Porphyridium purpureum]|eukprot:POR3295..scf227_4
MSSGWRRSAGFSARFGGFGDLAPNGGASAPTAPAALGAHSESPVHARTAGAATASAQAHVLDADLAMHQQQQPWWPGCVIAPDESDVHYDAAQFASVVQKRDVRTKDITMYKSKYEESAGRKIAADTNFISYSVNGHIRVLSDDLSTRTLLKGHDDAIDDMEFFAQTVALPDGGVQSCLASCGVDGLVFLWTIVRMPGDTLGEDVIKCTDSMKWRHPRPKGRYSRVTFCKTAHRLALVDRESDSVRLIMAERAGFSSRTHYRELELSSSTGSPLCAAAWLSKDRILTATVGGTVDLWDPDTGVRLHTFEPHGGRAIFEMQALSASTFFTIDANTNSILTWYIPSSASESESVANAPSRIGPERKQSITLNVGSRSGMAASAQYASSFLVAGCEPASEFVLLMDITRRTLFVLHVDVSTLWRFDCITEIQPKRDAISFCVSRKSPAAASGESPVLCMYAVQLKAIQLLEIVARDCMPGPSSVPTTFCKPAVTQSSYMLPVPGTTGTGAAMQQQMRDQRQPNDEQQHEQQHTSPMTLSSLRPGGYEIKTPNPTPIPVGRAGSSRASGGGGGGARTISSARSSPPSASPRAASPPTSGANTPAQARSTMGAPVVPSLAAAVSMQTFELDLCAKLEKQCMIVVEQVQASNKAQEAAFSDKLARLCTSVESTLKSSMQGMVESACRREMAGAMVSMSETVSNSLEHELNEAALRDACRAHAKTMVSGPSSDAPQARNELQLAYSDVLFSAGMQEHLERLMEESQVSGTFSSACDMMAAQISEAIARGMEHRFMRIVSPEMERACALASQAADKSHTMNSCLGGLILTTAAAANGLGLADKSPPVDYRANIIEHMARQSIEDALEELVAAAQNQRGSTAGGDNETSLTLWFCSEWDPEIFEAADKVVSSRAMLGLISCLSDVLEADVELAFRWLHEVLLMLELDDDDEDGVHEYAASVLEPLSAKLGALYETASLPSKLQKRCKVLRHLMHRIIIPLLFAKLDSRLASLHSIAYSRLLLPFFSCCDTRALNYKPECKYLVSTAVTGLLRKDATGCSVSH